MPRFRIISDLHLEFRPFSLRSLLSQHVDALFLAGDISTFTKRHIASEFLRECTAETKAPVFLVLGNHDFYGGSLKEVKNWWKENTPDGVHLLNQNIIPLSIGDKTYKVMGTTLWTDVPSNANDILNDYHCINGISVDAVRNEFHSDRRWLESELQKTSPEDNVIVMTHHLPSMKSIHPKYHSMPSCMNECFASNLDYVFEKSQPQLKMWIHGHTHSPLDYLINNTRVVCNPRGYPRENPNDGGLDVIVDV